ncbi:MAG: flavin reductase family protein [Christensenellales bacterium]|jgi:flavin reductase (DIM6/NTAB) family NADH-FMN oxidoreductase RutF
MEFTKYTQHTNDRLAKNGVLLISGKQQTNAMTIGWGFAGIMWGLPFFIAPVRPSRYTFELLSKEDQFNIFVPKDDSFNKTLAYCGSKSGRNVDKFAELGLEKAPAKYNELPIINAPGIHYECKLHYIQALNDTLPEALRKRWYPADSNLHTCFYGEILACYET